MTLEELEIKLKEMREQGAIDDTEINLYSVSNDLDFFISDMNFYLPETRANYIEISVHEKF